MTEHVHLWQSVGTIYPSLKEYAGCRCGAQNDDPSVILTVKEWIKTSDRAWFGGRPLAVNAIAGPATLTPRGVR